MLGLQGLIVIAAVLVGVQAEQATFTVPPQDANASLDRVSTPVLTSAVRADVQKILSDAGVPGTSLAFITRDGPTEFANFGIRSEEGDPMTSDTLFTIASCSKAFVASAIGILMEDYATGRNSTPLPPGLTKFDWDTKIKDLLPGEWHLMDEWAEEKADVKDILSHTSGLPRCVLFSYAVLHDMSYYRRDTLVSVLARVHLLRPSFELRERWSYNNIMYMISAHIIETYTGSFTSFVHDRLFAPLNMTASTYSPAKALASGKATHAFSSDGRRLPWWFEEDDYELSAGPGGIIASTEGLSNWVSTLLHEGVNPATNKTVLSKDIFETTTTSRAVMLGVGTKTESIVGYGLGWMRVSYLGHDIVWHSGSVVGIGTLVMFAPQDGVGLVLLSNADASYVTNLAAAWRVFRAAFDIKNDAPAPSLADVDKRVPPREDTKAQDRRAEELPAGVDFTGAYSASGYGPGFVLCNTSSTSSYCLDLLASYSAALGTLSPTTLYGHWPRLWSSDVRLVHHNGTRFALDLVSLFPSGFGRNHTGFAVLLSGDENGPWADFALEDGVVKGFGLDGTVGEKTMREKKGGSVQETADAWFMRT
ncbi:beta-lactamase/transpeptidase-like protein [Vararia minispora EC-137]|uniref:Beta-lactamase/transpeptidase-like protein n=1 Tax=Vararia minispora EC-137 TaxID=1314806 RepID=A0ACB8QTX7_9AGAM|nr:beta-lactamase/transpeptidase-like protein [Vararia minispora EC-137]